MNLSFQPATFVSTDKILNFCHITGCTCPRFCGWGSDLLQTAQNNSLRISDAESWQLVWNKPVEEEQFTQTAWPKTQIDELSKLALNSLNSETLDAFSLKASNDGRPGCVVEALQAPTKFMLARAAGLVDRPKPPDSVIGNSPAVSKQIASSSEISGAYFSKRRILVDLAFHLCTTLYFVCIIIVYTGLFHIKNHLYVPSFYMRQYLICNNKHW